ncbi:hypothetical protein B4U80_12380, partial [Leptotrombidium deliense]
VSFAKEDTKEYDYAVVGCGTAGCVVAARLAQDKKNYSILVIEAGDMPPYLTKIVPF